MNYQFVKNLVAASTIALVAGNTYAMHTNAISPFVGIDGTYLHTKGKGDYNKFLPRHYPGVNLYVGGKVHENFGVEFGWETSTRRTRTHVFTAGETVFGATGITGSSITRVRFHGAHLDANGYYPICHKVELLGSVGIGFEKPKMDAYFNGANSPLKAKSKSVLRLRGGAQYMATESIGVRGLVGWSNTSRIRVDGLTDFFGPNAPSRPFKNSIFGSVGVFVKF